MITLQRYNICIAVVKFFGTFFTRHGDFFNRLHDFKNRLRDS